jgi:hypothetical protein
MGKKILSPKTEEAIEKIDQKTAPLKETQERINIALAPLKETQEIVNESTAPIKKVQEKIAHLTEPYKQLAQLFPNLESGRIFTENFLEKHGDVPLKDLYINQAESDRTANTEEIFNLTLYLPMGDTTVEDYSKNIQKIIDVNLNGDQYQFAYLATHLLFMTYMYSVVWRTSRLNPSRYIDVLTFLKGFDSKAGVNFYSVNSIFDYHNMHEGDTFEFLKIIGIDNSYICELKEVIKRRNGMAHANGGFEMNTRQKYDDAISNIVAIVDEINKKIESPIKEWYQNQLIKYMITNEDKIDEFIDNLINIENLSIKELEVCSKYGLARIKNRRYYPNFTPDQIKLVEKLHKKVKEKYKSLSGV